MLQACCTTTTYTNNVQNYEMYELLVFFLVNENKCRVKNCGGLHIQCKSLKFKQNRHFQ